MVFTFFLFLANGQCLKFNSMSNICYLYICYSTYIFVFFKDFFYLFPSFFFCILPLFWCCFIRNATGKGSQNFSLHLASSQLVVVFVFFFSGNRPNTKFCVFFSVLCTLGKQFNIHLLIIPSTTSVTTSLTYRVSQS